MLGILKALLTLPLAVIKLAVIIRKQNNPKRDGSIKAIRKLCYAIREEWIGLRVTLGLKV